MSGDNEQVSYDEPKYMYEALLEYHIPPDSVIQDGGGLRTMDSILRARDVYESDRYIVVSQPFHLKRAIFLARIQ